MIPLPAWMSLGRTVEYLRMTTTCDVHEDDVVVLIRKLNLKALVNVMSIPGVKSAEIEWFLVGRNGLYKDFGGERLQNYVDDGRWVVSDYAKSLLESGGHVPLTTCRIKLDDGSEYMPNTKASFDRGNVLVRGRDIEQLARKMISSAGDMISESVKGKVCGASENNNRRPECMPPWVPVATMRACFREVWPGNIDEAFRVPRGWLRKHIKEKAARGKKRGSLYDPVGVAIDLMDGSMVGGKVRRHVPRKMLTAVFSTPELAEWLPKWQEHLSERKQFE